MIKNIIGFLISIFVGYILNDLISLFREWALEKVKHKNQANLQIESYFRQLSGKDVREVLDKWVTLIDKLNKEAKSEATKNPKKKKSKNKFDLDKYVKDLQYQTIMYGSSDTIKIFGEMMQHVYKLNSSPNTKSKKSSSKTLLYTACMIASLKKDFTGYEVKPIEYLKIILTDLDIESKQKHFNEAKKEVESEISNTGVKIIL